MKFFVGTSAYRVPEWKGSFYPEKLPLKKMLNYYGQHFSTVGVNYTFRRMPTAALVEGWAEQVPEHFRFSLKSPQTITHFKRLKGVDDEVNTFIEACLALKDRLGPLMFQLPPNFQIDLERLEALLKLVNKRVHVAFEFRHESWFCEDVYKCLKKHAAALCLADTDEEPIEKIISTTSKWGYIRLRKDDYTDAQLKQWIKKLKAEEWEAAYIYFKHEDTGNGPRLAKRFLELAE